MFKLNFKFHISQKYNVSPFNEIFSRARCITYGSTKRSFSRIAQRGDNSVNLLGESHILYRTTQSFYSRNLGTCSAYHYHTATCKWWRWLRQLSGFIYSYTLINHAQTNQDTIVTSLLSLTGFLLLLLLFCSYTNNFLII